MLTFMDRSSGTLLGVKVSGKLTESPIVRMYVRNSEFEIPPRARGWLAILYYAIRHHDPGSEEIHELDQFKWKKPKPNRKATGRRTSQSK